MISFSQLIVKTTEDLVYGTIRTAAGLVGVDVEALPDNEPIRAILKSVVPRAIYVACGEVIPIIAASGFLEFAPEGPWLYALGEQVYGVEHIEEDFATTQVLFTNTGDLAGSFAANQMIVKNGTTGKTYKCAAFSIGASGDPGSVNVPVDVIAFEAGTGSNAAIGQINQVVTTFDGLTVTNPAAAMGQDQESRADYIARCKAAPAAASPFGPKNAYEYFARSAERPDGTAIGATRVKVIADDPYVGLTVYIADTDGPISGGDADIIEAIFLEKVIGHGVAYNDTLPAVANTINVVFTAKALTSAGLSSSDINTMAQEALAVLFSSWPIGGYNGFFYQSKIRSTIEEMKTADGGTLLIDVQVSTPSGNVTLDVDNVPVLGTVNSSITFV
jgi:hypothetical protein